MHKEYERKIIEKVDKMDKDDIIEYVKKYSSLMDEILDYIKMNNIELYNEIECSLYEMAYGETLSLEMAEKWVKSLQPMGKYTKIETDEILDEYGLNLSPIDFYVAINLICSDYGKTLDEVIRNLNEQDKIKVYVKMARDFLNDEDAIKNKLYKYWKDIIKH